MMQDKADEYINILIKTQESILSRLSEMDNETIRAITELISFQKEANEHLSRINGSVGTVEERVTKHDALIVENTTSTRYIMWFIGIVMVGVGGILASVLTLLLTIWAK